MACACRPVWRGCGLVGLGRGACALVASAAPRISLPFLLHRVRHRSDRGPADLVEFPPGWRWGDQRLQAWPRPRRLAPFARASPRACAPGWTGSPPDEGSRDQKRTVNWNAASWEPCGLSPSASPKLYWALTWAWLDRRTPSARSTRQRSRSHGVEPPPGRSTSLKNC